MENSQKGWTLLKQSVVYVQEIALKKQFWWISQFFRLHLSIFPALCWTYVLWFWGPLTAEYISWVDDVRPASGRNLVQVQVQSKAPWFPKGRSLRLVKCHSGGIWYGKSATRLQTIYTWSIVTSTVNIFTYIHANTSTTDVYFKGVKDFLLDMCMCSSRPTGRRTLHGPNSISINNGGFLLTSFSPMFRSPKWSQNFHLEKCLLTQIDTIWRHVS